MSLPKSRRKKHRKRAVIIVLLCLFAVYLIAVNFMVSAALVPSFMRKLDAFQTISDESFAELVQTDSLTDNANAESAVTDEWFDSVTHENQTVTTPEGYTLDAEIFDPAPFYTDVSAAPEHDNSHTWVLLLHGYTGWKQDMYEYACWFSKMGCHCVVPDLRAQGSSEGDFIGMGATDRYDCLLWLDRILELDPDAEIIIYGQSMGAATALMMSGLTELTSGQYPVRAIISDSSYTDAYTMFVDKAKEWFNVPPVLFVPAAAVCLKLRGGYWLYDASAVEAVKQSNIPTLFIHGSDDEMIDVSQCYELYDAASCEKQLLIVSGAGHCQAAQADPLTYFSTIRDFAGL
ncbi:MAG: alpha/beta hydrolase [Lachnospiraceae bacterium]